MPHDSPRGPLTHLSAGQRPTGSDVVVLRRGSVTSAIVTRAALTRNSHSTMEAWAAWAAWYRAVSDMARGLGSLELRPRPAGKALGDAPGQQERGAHTP